MNPHWEYVPFEKLFIWKEKSKIKSGDGKSIGKYKMFVCSDTEIKRYDEYIEKGESLVFGTGGKASCHFVDEPFAYSTDCVAAQRKSENILTKFYYYYFRQNHLGELQRTFTGSGLQHTSKKKISKIMVPVLSFDEQNLIVTLIEELLSQLDAGVAELQAAKKRLKVYRQAVLKEAFEGKLTDAVSKGIFPIRDFIETPRYGTSKKCSYNNSEYSTPVYRIPNVDYTLGRIRHNDIKYTVFSKSELEGIRLKEGDILIIRSNGSVSLVGRAAIIYNCDTKGTFAGYLMRLRIKNTEVLEPKYLLWYLQSLDARMYIENKAKSTSGVHNINSTEIAELQIPLYTHKEQLDIIKSIETRLSVCDSIELTVDTALQQAEALRQSILKQAFEGKL